MEDGLGFRNSDLFRQQNPRASLSGTAVVLLLYASITISPVRSEDMPGKYIPSLRGNKGPAKGKPSPYGEDTPLIPSLPPIQQGPRPESTSGRQHPPMLGPPWWAKAPLNGYFAPPMAQMPLLEKQTGLRVPLPPVVESTHPEHPNEMTGWDRPRVAFISTCSGSTAFNSLAQEILKFHGAPIYYHKKNDLVLFGLAAKELKNSTRHHETLVFATHGSDGSSLKINAETMDTLRSFRSYYVHVARQNSLDRAICSVHDGLSDNIISLAGADAHLSSLGKVVSRENGDFINEQAFARRRKEGAPNAVRFNVSVLVPVLSAMVDMQTTQHLDLIHSGLQEDEFKSVIYEDLMAFQYGETAGQTTSLSAWKVVLQSWGVEPNKELLRRWFAGRFGTFHAPLPHEEGIFNYEEVCDAFQHDDRRLLSFLREAEKYG
jgi:hypothetical protein